VDQFGFGGDDKACRSPDHGHPVPSNPLVEERGTLEAIRARLRERGLETAIYTEQFPCDIAAPLVDGAFDYGFGDGRRPAGHDSPRFLPLHRYVFPEIAPIEMVAHGIRPYSVEAGILNLCLFHGVAVWLKGRGDSWFSEDFRRTARAWRPILEEHGDVFRGEDCTPLVPTLREVLFANRFRKKDRILIALYNAGRREIQGDLAALDLPLGWAGTDLLRGAPAETRTENGNLILSGRVDPEEAAVWLFRPKMDSKGETDVEVP